MKETQMKAKELQQKLDDLTRPMIHEALVTIEGRDAKGELQQDWKTILADKFLAVMLRDIDLYEELTYTLTIVTDETEEGAAEIAAYKKLVLPKPKDKRHDVWLPIDPSTDSPVDVLVRQKLADIAYVRSEEFEARVARLKGAL